MGIYCGMAQSKIKINIEQGIFEAEGAEHFVREMHKEFEGLLKEVRSKKVEKEEPLKSTKKSKHAFVLVPNINFSPTDNLSLHEFHAGRHPRNAFENNTFFVYYIQKVLRMTEITANHIYTCYQHLNISPSNAFRQSLIDTSHKKGYLDTSNMQNIILTIKGENFIERQLPKE